MKKLLLAAILALSCSSAFAQNKDAIIRDFLRSVGEADTTTGSVTGAIARTWMNEFFREAAYYGVFMRETLYVTAAQKDTFILPSDFLFAQSVKLGRDVTRAPAPRGRNRFFELSDTAPNFYERIDTVVTSTWRPDTTLQEDVVGIRYCYKKNYRATTGNIMSDTGKAIRPLLYIPPDSMGWFGQALSSRMLPPRFLAERIDTIVLSTVRPDTTLRSDVFGIRYLYKKAATEKSIRPLIQVSPDSLEKIGRALTTRVLPPEFLSERLDTLIPSTTTPINSLRTDVFDIRAAYKKESGTGKLLPLVRVAADSLQKISVNPIDYYYFSGQPSPRIVFGQKRSFNDTMYLEVVVASDFYSFSGNGVPRIVMGKIPTTADTLFATVIVPADYYTFIGLPTPSIRFGRVTPAVDTCFCQVRAINPMYGFIANDTSVHKLERPLQKFLTLSPPPIKAETLWVNYAAMADTIASSVDSLRPIFSMETAVRPAINHYLKEQYYRRKGFEKEADYWLGRWRELLMRHTFQRGIKVATPASR